jgi:hypothetical protein
MTGIVLATGSGVILEETRSSFLLIGATKDLRAGRLPFIKD